MNIQNLQEMVNIFEQDSGIPERRKQMTRVTSKYLAHEKNVKSIADIEISDIPRETEWIKNYLEKNKPDFAWSTVRNYASFYQRFVDWGVEKKLLPPEPKNILLPEWEEISRTNKNMTSAQKGRALAMRKLGYWATNEKISINKLSTEDLRRYTIYLENESAVKDWKDIYYRSRKEWQNLSNIGRVPNLVWAELPKIVKDAYGIALENWPSKMKKEYYNYRNWCLAEYREDRPRRFKQRKVSADQNLSTLTRIVGYAHYEQQVPLNEMTFDIVFKKKLIWNYVNWMVTERLGGITTVTLERMVAQLLAMARGYFGRDDDVSWLLELKLKIRANVKARRTKILVPIENLIHVADCIGARRKRILKNAERKGSKSSELGNSRLYRDELVLRIIIARPLRQRNIREMVLGRNLRSGDDKNWELYFTDEETKAGNTIQFHLPAELNAMVDEYLNIHRPILLRGHKSDWVFPNTGGVHICASTIQRIVKLNCLRFLDKAVTPHLIRDCVAYWWLKRNPKDYLTVSQLLGHKDINTTINLYSHFDSELAATLYDQLLSDELKKKDLKDKIDEI